MNVMQVESESMCSFDFHGLICLCEFILEGMIASVAKATRNQQTSPTQQASGSAGGLLAVFSWRGLGEKSSHTGEESAGIYSNQTAQ